MPRFGPWALMPILLGALSGCLWDGEGDRSNWVHNFKNQVFSPDHALVEFALIERPLGDPYINEELWKHTDELAVDLKKRGIRATLDDNGFRVGQLVSTPPSEFQKLLLSPHSCSNPKALIFPSGRTAPLHFPAAASKLAYDLIQGSERTEIELEQARFCFNITARFDTDGKTILTFTPKVEHGGPTLPFHASPERSAWELRTGKAAKSHNELSFEITLGPNQYLVIGGRRDREQTLGAAAFLDDTTEVQRLLVVRNCRSVTSAEAQSHSAGQLLRANGAAPLVLHAIEPTTRAKSN